MPRLTFRLLGGFDVQLDGRPANNFRSQKARALLAYLVIEAERPQERATLAALFWPEMTDGLALRNLSQTLIWLRRAIGDDNSRNRVFLATGGRQNPVSNDTSTLLILTRRQVQWNREATADVDAIRFQKLLERRGTPGVATTADLEAAVALYRGEFLAGFNLSGCPAFDEWLLLQREYLRRLALEAFSTLTTQSLTQRRYEAAANYARQQLALDHWREAAYRQLLQALATDGRHSEALAEYERARRLLSTELGVELQPETVQLAEAIRQRSIEIEDSKLETGRSISNLQSPISNLQISHNLPIRLTPLLGRETEMAQLEDWLRDATTRLVTVTGIGGSGKTRLAQAAASSFIEQSSIAHPSYFPDGVWFVPLAGLGGSEVGAEEELLTAVATTLNLTFTARESRVEQLGRFLHGRRLLLVLDNIEHLLRDGTDQPSVAIRTILLDLLQHAPGVSMLVTSRQRLNLRGERVLMLEGLPVPSANAARGKETLLSYSSARLFFERALDRGVRLILDETERQALVRICTLTEGLPLAIELAAVWAGHFTCAEIAAEIASNLDFLNVAEVDVPPRQRSPRAAFDYSWQLLSVAEQRALAQMALLRGRFHREAALAVSEARLVELLSLVDKSLLRQVAAGWYTFHPLIRQFALEHLEHLRLAEAAEMRHATYFLRQVTRREIPLQGSASLATRAEVRVMMENVRHAWHFVVWTLADALMDSEQQETTNRTLDLLNEALYALVIYYRLEGLRLEGQEALETLMNALSAKLHAVPSAVSGRIASLLSHALAWQTILQVRRNYDVAAALSSAEAAVALGQQTEDKLAQSMARYAEGLALGFSTDVLHWKGRFDRIYFCLEEAITFSREVQETNGAVVAYRARLLEVEALNRLAYTFSTLGDWPLARDYCEQALALCREKEYLPGEGLTSTNLAEILEKEGSFERALHYREAAYHAYRQVGDPDMESIGLNNLCGVWTRLGEYEKAQTLGRRALEIRQRHGLVSPFLYHSLALATYHRGDFAAALQLAAQGMEEGPLGSQISYLQLLTGEIYIRLGEWTKAEETLQGAVALLRFHQEQPLAVAVRAALADLALARGNVTDALAHVEVILSPLLLGQVNNHLEPLRSFYICYQVLDAANDPRRDEVLAAAYERLQSQTALIKNETLNYCFLYCVAVHREITTAWSDKRQHSNSFHESKQ